MDIDVGDNALAVRAGAGWILYPVCDGEIEGNALAVRAGSDWMLAPVREPENGDDALAVRASDGWVVTALACPDEDDDDDDDDPPCQGSDPRCGECPCEADLPEIFFVSISGFPTICGVDAFNGVWPVQWHQNCMWEYWISPWERVALVRVQGGGWRVGWSVQAPGGAGGVFTAPATCPPDGQPFTFYSCDNVMGCFGMCDAIAGATVTVSR